MRRTSISLSGMDGEGFFHWAGQAWARPKIYGAGRAYSAYISWLKSHASAEETLIYIAFSEIRQKYSEPS